MHVRCGFTFGTLHSLALDNVGHLPTISLVYNAFADSAAKRTATKRLAFELAYLHCSQIPIQLTRHGLCAAQVRVCNGVPFYGESHVLKGM